MTSPARGPARRVGVVGAGGRMGHHVCQAVVDDPALELVAAIDPRLAGVDLRQALGLDVASKPGVAPLQVAADVDELARADAEVAVDFTVADAAVATMHWCAAHDVHTVVGTTGIASSELTELAEAFDSSAANCVVAPNFAIGAVLMMRFAQLAAPYMQEAEIVELHHEGKLDAPSGTALHTAELLARARGDADTERRRAPLPVDEVVPGARGGRGPGGVRIHAVRLPGLVSHQEVIFGARGQSLTLRHDSYDRSCFIPGVMLAVRAVDSHPGLTIGLDVLLGI